MSYRVLVAEDEDIIRRGIVCSIDWRRLGCGQIDEACNGQEALEHIQTGVYDLVLMDINMPLLGGLEVLEQTCQGYGYVAIIITGYSDFDYAKRALKYGAVEYVLKPIDIAELTRAIEKACAERERRLTYRKLKEGLLVPPEPVQLLTPVAALPAEETEDGEVVARMLDYIEKNVGKKITLSILSQELFYSESFMTRRFKSEMGMNFTDYLNRYRIQCALSMLRQGRSRLSDISAACGFSDYKYFNNVFKKYVGCSAKLFMQKMSGEPHDVN